MKILFTRFPLESAYGGAETQTISLMKGLKNKGHTTHFMGSCPILLTLAKQHAIDTTHLDIGEPPVSKLNLLRFWWYQGWRKKQLTRAYDSLGKFDAVCMLSLSEKILLTKHVVQKNVNTIWIEHDPIGRWLRYNPWRRTLAKQSGSVNTVTVSAYSKHLYHDMGWSNDHIVPIPNGIDPERLLTEKGPPAPHGTHQLHLGCVARFALEKGVDVLLHAIVNCPNVHLHLLGKGPREAVLRGLTQSLGISERVTFHEHVPNIRDFYDQIDALVLPSRTHDPFGLVAGEAMFLGIPVIVTDMCGISTYLHHEQDSLIVPAHNVGALQEAILRLEDDAFRSILSTNGAETAQNTFSIEAMIDTYEKLLSVKHH